MIGVKPNMIRVALLVVSHAILALGSQYTNAPGNGIDPRMYGSLEDVLKLSAEEAQSPGNKKPRTPIFQMQKKVSLANEEMKYDEHGQRWEPPKHKFSSPNSVHPPPSAGVPLVNIKSSRRPKFRAGSLSEDPRDHPVNSSVLTRGERIMRRASGVSWTVSSMGSSGSTESFEPGARSAKPLDMLQDNREQQRDTRRRRYSLASENDDASGAPLITESEEVDSAPGKLVIHWDKAVDTTKKFPKRTFLTATLTTLGSAGCFIAQAFTKGAAQDWFLGTGIGLAVASVVLWSIFTYQCANGRCCNKVNGD